MRTSSIKSFSAKTAVVLSLLASLTIAAENGSNTSDPLSDNSVETISGLIFFDGPVELSLPDSLLQNAAESIMFELNQIDVTEMISISEESISYQPAVPLELGAQVMLATNIETGQVIARWEFEKQISEESLSSLAIDSQFIASHRLADKNIGSPKPKQFHGQANSQIGFSHQTNQWQLEGGFDLYYDSIEENRFTDRTVENGEFLVSISNQFANAHIGHQTIGNGSLVMDNFSRRGVSVGGVLSSIDAKVSGFSLSSNEIYGFGGGLGISNARQRVDGFYFESNPISDSPSLLSLSGTWLKGEATAVDEYTAQPDPMGGGSVNQSWSLAGESLMLDERLLVVAEYARSEFDLDRSDGLSAEQDSAYKLGLSFSDVSQTDIAWSVGLLHENIGTFFQSIANQGLAADKKLTQFNSSLQSENLLLQFSTETHQDNVESIELLPTIETQINNMSLNWSPQLTNTTTWLGTPSFALALIEQDQKEINMIAAATPQIDSEVFSWQVSSNFSYQVNSWGMNLSNTDFIDRTGFQNDSNTVGVSVYSNLIFGEKISMSVSIGLDEIDDLVEQVSSTSFNYALQSVILILPDKLDFSFDYSVNQNETSDFLINGKNSAINFAINWKILEQAVNQFGIDLSLSSAYNDFDDRLMTFNSIESHQSFLTLTATLPARLGNSE